MSKEKPKMNQNTWGRQVTNIGMELAKDVDPADLKREHLTRSNILGYELMDIGFDMTGREITAFHEFLGKMVECNSTDLVYNPAVDELCRYLIAIGHEKVAILYHSLDINGKDVIGKKDD